MIKYTIGIVIFIISISVYFLPQEIKIITKDEAIDSIVNYAKNQNLPAPTFETYKTANIKKVTSDNIEALNKILVKKGSEKHSALYRYDVRDDYNMNFKHAIFDTIPALIQNNKIVFTNLKIDNNSTVFLKIHINTSKLGKYFTPKIILTEDNKTISHTFEASSDGIRYLNLSRFTFQSENSISIAGDFIDIQDQNATLMVFKNPKIKNKKILIIAPHPDDAEIAAYGLYSKYNTNVHIVTITAGNAGTHLGYNQVFNSINNQRLAKGKKRIIDSITVPLFGGVPPERCINLGFFDAKLIELFVDREQVPKDNHLANDIMNNFRKYNVSSLVKELDSTYSWSSLVSNLSSLINTIQPDIIVSPHPVLDKHTDHIYTTKAVVQAIQKSKIKEGLLFLYTNHSSRAEYYPYGEQGEPITLPASFSQKEYFNSIYSHPLTQMTQQDKIIALEAMSDLRFTPQGSLFESPCKGKLPILCTDYSYVRRSVRDNELFFIINIKNL